MILKMSLVKDLLFHLREYKDAVDVFLLLEKTKTQDVVYNVDMFCLEELDTVSRALKKETEEGYYILGNALTYSLDIQPRIQEMTSICGNICNNISIQLESHTYYKNYKEDLANILEHLSEKDLDILYSFMPNLEKHIRDCPDIWRVLLKRKYPDKIIEDYADTRSIWFS